MPYVYVLHSASADHYYTGATENLENRLLQHNSDQCRSTKNRGPWSLVHHEEFGTLADALRRERFLKSGKGRDELRRILEVKKSNRRKS